MAGRGDAGPSPAVSVVIPVLNGAPWLAQQLEALKRQMHYRYPARLGGFFRQGFRYGFAGAIVKARYGAFPAAGRATMRSFAGPLRLVMLGPSKGARARGLFLLGRRIGMVSAVHRPPADSAAS